MVSFLSGVVGFCGLVWSKKGERSEAGDSAFAVVDASAGALAVSPLGVLAGAVAAVSAAVEVVGDRPRYLVLSVAVVVSSQTTVSNSHPAQPVSAAAEVARFDALLQGLFLHRESGEAEGDLGGHGFVPWVAPPR